MSAIPYGRADRGIISALVLVAIVLSLPRLHGPIDLRFDAGVYYLTGTALGAGHGYRILSEPGDIQAVQYPPLLPAIVAVVQRSLGSSDPAVAGHALRVLYLLLFLAYSVAAYAVGRHFLSPPWALFAALLATVNVYTVFFSNILQAELPYALTTLLFFLAALPLAERRRLGTKSVVRAWLPELLAVAAFLLRTSGVALLGAWVAENLLRRRWRRAVAGVLVSASCIGGWQAYVLHVKTDPEYMHPAYPYQRSPYQFYNVGYVENLLYVDPSKPELGTISVRDFAARVGGNLRALPARLGNTVSYIFPLESRMYSNLSSRVTGRLASFFGVLVLAGLAVLVVRRQWLLPSYVGASLVLISITPWPEQMLRYLWPLAPLLSIATAVGLAAGTEALDMLAGKMREPKPVVMRAPAIGIAGVMLGLQVFAVTAQLGYDHRPVTYRGRDGRQISYHLVWYDRSWTAFDAAIDWLVLHAEPGDIVLTFRPHWLFIRAGLKAVMPPFEVNPALAQELVDAVPAKYVVVDNHYVLPMLERFAERWKRVYGGDPDTTTIYERTHADPP